ncbi:pimeloyl-ACP methyl ester esterase BioH [Psychromonas sp. GE-S-Ul-11]|uniref:pimeloyl-ACP methyl ester esterase BioH n=1 Tax=Psychromonas sp. GE-S-Ul-11 TaxID=3241170 RepID=UPI00390C4EA1
MSIEQKMKQNGPFAYQTFGTGKDLVLIHGWGVNSTIWEPVVKQLSDHYCVHLVNLPGFAGEPELEAYTLENIAETLLAYLPEKAVWCGWSLGGLIATHIAYHYPARVEKLIQVCSALKFVEEGQWQGVEKSVFSAFKLGVTKQPQKTVNRFLSTLAMGSNTVKTDIATIKQLMSEQIGAKPSALLGGLVLLDEVDLRQEFSQLTMPSLTILGEQDNLVSVVNKEKLAELSSINQQVIFQQSSHAPFISEPILFHQVLISFIGSQKQ